MLPFKENLQPEVFLLACILLFAYLVFPGPMKQLAKNKLVMLILLVLLTWYHAFLGFLLAALYLSLLHTSAGKEGYENDDEEDDDDDDGDKKKKKGEDEDEDEEDDDEKTKTPYPFATALSNMAVSDAGQNYYNRYCIKGKLKEGTNKDEIKKLKKQLNMSGCKDPCQKKCKFSGGGGKVGVKSGGGGGSFGGF